MPFRSEKQRRFMWANHPTIARRWANEHKSKRQPDHKKLREDVIHREIDRSLRGGK